MVAASHSIRKLLRSLSLSGSDDVRIRGLRQASSRCIFDILSGECEGDAKTIVRRLRQAATSPEDSSNKNELEVIEGLLLRLQDVPEDEIAGLVAPVRSGEALSEVDSRRNKIDLLRHRLYHNKSIVSALSESQYKEEVPARLDAGQGVDATSQWLEHAVPPEESAASDTVNTGVPLPRTTSSAGFSGDGKSDQQNLASPGNKKQSQSTGTNFPPEVLMWTTNMSSYFRVSPRILSQQMFSGAADQNFMDHMSTPLQMSDMNPRTWTSVTQDMSLVQHLLALYFCWEYPIFATIHKEYFLADFLSGRQRYCSTGLVNAILALGCLFSSEAGSDCNPVYLRSLSDQFFKQSLRSSAQASTQYSLVNIQALGILSLRELRCGRNAEGRYYAGQSMRLAIEMGLNKVGHDGEEGHVAVATTTFWGAFALDNAWTLVMGLLPLTSRGPLLPSRPPIHPDIEASPWAPYPNEGNNVPEALRLGTNFTPPVFFVHIYYNCSVLLLFRPFIRLRIDGSHVIPQDVCTEAADTVRGLIRSYAQLYGLQRSPSFLPYLTLITATMHLTVASVKELESSAATATAQSAMLTNDVQHVIATAPLDLRDLASAVGSLAAQDEMPRSRLAPDVTDALRQGISHLTEMERYNHTAKEALDTLEHLCALWTDGGAHTEAQQQQQAQSFIAFSFHVQGQFRVASGISLRETVRHFSAFPKNPETLLREFLSSNAFEQWPDPYGPDKYRPLCQMVTVWGNEQDLLTALHYIQTSIGPAWFQAPENSQGISFCASRLGYLDILDVILANSVDINTTNRHGVTALHNAVLGLLFSYKACSYLLDRGAALDGSAVVMSVFHLACYHTDDVEIPKLLWSHGADVQHAFEIRLDELPKGSTPSQPQ
ncbi:hypothetical protein PG993_005496 [Apiospora rasikravindrae]|uniref:Xylanolytic transcriptional activator regulatory domain-containing protein n=1 Tax=Apiospora rasikravindrae TaxID=990691 RepID=A0ABR1TGF1_9PEZI